MNDIRPDAVLKGVEVIEFPGPCSGKATPGRSASPLKRIMKLIRYMQEKSGRA